jgi:hypothetical protein
MVLSIGDVQVGDNLRLPHWNGKLEDYCVEEVRGDDVWIRHTGYAKADYRLSEHTDWEHHPIPNSVCAECDSITRSVNDYLCRKCRS